MTNSRPSLTVHTQADLERLWHTLMQPLGFRSRTLWLMVIQDDAPIPGLVEISDLPLRPEPEDGDGLRTLLTMFDAEVTPGTRVALLVSRPGLGGADSTDRVWAQTLYDAASGAGARCETVHLATDDRIVPIPLDDLVMQVRRPS